MVKKEEFKAIRDQVAPILVDHARLEMLNCYKPGLVEPLGEATVGLWISTRPIRQFKGPFIQRDFYACYKILIPLRPLIPLKDPSAREILQEHIQTKIQAMYGQIHEVKPESTLVVYWTDLWVTREGEVWHEDAEGVWSKVLQLPEGLLQFCYINLRSTLHVKYIV